MDSRACRVPQQRRLASSQWSGPKSVRTGPALLRWPERAVKLVANEAAYWVNLGVAHYRQGDGRAAIAAIERAASLRKHDEPADSLMLALAYWKLGENDRSRSCYDRAIQRMQKSGWENDESYRFRDEAADLLGLAELPHDVFAGP